MRSALSVLTFALFLQNTIKLYYTGVLTQHARVHMIHLLDGAG
jgi:hypothetical protein